MKSVEWGEYKIKDLFKEVKIRRKLTKSDLSNDYEFPAYSSESNNSGIIGYSVIPEFICNKQTPIYVIFGDHTRNINLAKKSFSVLDNVKVLLPFTNNEDVLLFVIASWYKEIPNLGYARHWKIAKNCFIKLPTKNNKIDFDFMESFIAELKAERLAELKAYLQASGLDDYELTDEEKKIVDEYKNHKICLSEFSFSKVFNRIEQGRRLKKADQQKGSIPFVMSGITNTGVVGYISNPVAFFPENSITIDIFGNSFYRKYAFGAGDDTGVYWNDRCDYSTKMMLYFTAAMEKTLKGKFSYGKKLRSSQSLNFKMQLPTKDGKPDYELMEILISAIQKLVIKDVVLYADNKIKTTETIIEQNDD